MARHGKHGRPVTVYIREKDFEPLMHGKNGIVCTFEQKDAYSRQVEIEQHRLHKDPKTLEWVIKGS